jgi:hypothetical protein
MGYWTKKRLVRIDRKISYHPPEGYTKSDVGRPCDVREIIEIPVYASRLGSLTRFVAGIGLLSLLALGTAKVVYDSASEDVRVESEQSLVERVE